MFADVLTKKMKLERKRQFDKMIAKRFEHVRERVRLNEIKKKTMRKNKRELSALNHGKWFASTHQIFVISKRA